MPKPPVTTYTVVIAAGDGGTTVPAPGIYELDSGTSINVTAYPYPGYHFDSWIGSGETSDTVNLSRAATVTAVFVADPVPPNPTPTAINWVAIGVLVSAISVGAYIHFAKR